MHVYILILTCDMHVSTYPVTVVTLFYKWHYNTSSITRYLLVYTTITSVFLLFILGIVASYTVTSHCTHDDNTHSDTVLEVHVQEIAICIMSQYQMRDMLQLPFLRRRQPTLVSLLRVAMLSQDSTLKCGHLNDQDSCSCSP